MCQGVVVCDPVCGFVCCQTTAVLYEHGEVLPKYILCCIWGYEAQKNRPYDPMRENYGGEYRNYRIFPLVLYLVFPNMRLT